MLAWRTETAGSEGYFKLALRVTLNEGTLFGVEPITHPLRDFASRATDIIRLFDRP